MKRGGVKVIHEAEDATEAKGIVARGMTLVRILRQTHESPVQAMETLMAAIQCIHHDAPDYGRAQIVDCLRTLLGELGSAPGDA